MVETVGFMMVVVSVCVSCYLIGTCARRRGDVLALLAEKKAIRVESQRLRAIYAEQENEE